MANIVVKDYGTERVISVSTNHLNDSPSADSLSQRFASMLESDVRFAGLAESNSPLPEKGSNREKGSAPEKGSHCVSIQKLTLNFESVDWLTSQGLNELISINRIAKTRGIRLILANVQEPVRKVFALTRLERMFEVAEAEVQTQ